MKKFWQDKRVFITGHTGFKGSWLSLWLHTLGAKVTGYALPPNTEPNLFGLAHINGVVTSIFGDVCDLEKLKHEVLQAKPDIIFHLAAQPLVRYSYQSPVETYQTNVLGTVNILEAMRCSNTAKILINITTDKCYDNKEWHWGYREVDPIGGNDPYSSSKGCAELVTAAYRHSYFNPLQWGIHGKSIASVRAGNVIGGGDWSLDRLIPDVISALAQSKKPLIRFPQAIRPWQHVLEPLCGYLKLAEKMWEAPRDYAQAWNFGPYSMDNRTVAQVVQYICKIWSDDSSWERLIVEQPHEACFLKLDISKSISLLNWHPIWSFDKAINETVRWYQSWLQSNDMLTITLQQISEYTTLLNKYD